MLTLTKIFCPVDLSETSFRALGYAAALAKWYNARLLVLHVLGPPEPEPVMAPDGGLLEPRRRAPADAVAVELNRAMDAAGVADVAPLILADEKRTHETIVDYARAQGADLLVMGTHGRSGFNRLLLGSVTEKVLRAAPCPVLTVPPASEGTVTFRRILCAIDFSASSLEALKYALSLARESNGTVKLLYALEYMDPEEPCEHVDADVRRDRQHLIEHARRRLHGVVAAEDLTWCDIQEEVVIGRAYKMVLQRAAEAKADLIVMGAQGTGGLELMVYGSNTQHVLRAARCPVLTVHA
jgi:nucleotide-binding universal stress UspA family protein